MWLNGRIRSSSSQTAFGTLSIGGHWERIASSLSPVANGVLLRGDRLHLTWTERGGPRVSSPDHRGYGIRIVESVIAEEFGGAVGLVFDPDGLSMTLDPPVRQLDVEATKWSLRASSDLGHRPSTDPTLD